jgi:Zn-finger nucleic acid-binding protein
MPEPSLRCPRCPSSTLGEGPLHTCPRCEGVWIAEESLEEHVGKVPPPGTYSCELSKARFGLRCAVCRVPMLPINLVREPIDRCKEHGIWFDKHELRAVIERIDRNISATPTTRGRAPGQARPREHHAVAGAVADTLAFDVAVEGLVTGVQVAGEVATSGAIDALLEILGGIFSAIDF